MITGAISAMLVLSSISLFINGANIKFKYNIFGFFKGQFNISSSGLLDKIKEFKNIEKQHKDSLDKINSDLIEAKNNLEIKGKNVLKEDPINQDAQS